MVKVVDEYICYVWHRGKERYVQVGASLSHSFDDCVRFCTEHRVIVNMGKYSDFDFTDYQIKMRRITYTDWEVTYG